METFSDEKTVISVTIMPCAKLSKLHRRDMQQNVITRMINMIYWDIFITRVE